MLEPKRRIANNKGEIVYISGDLRTIMLYLLSYSFDVAVCKMKQYKITSKQHHENGQEYIDVTIKTEETTEYFENIPSVWGRIDVGIINSFLENKGN